MRWLKLDCRIYGKVERAARFLGVCLGWIRRVVVLGGSGGVGFFRDLWDFC